MQGADLILCRNVLMYFSPPRAAAVLHRLLGSLSREGLLLLSAVEAGIATQAGFTGTWAGCNYALASDARGGVRPSDDAPAEARPAPDWTPARATAKPARNIPRPLAVVLSQPAEPAAAHADERAAGPEQLWLQAQSALSSGHYPAARETLRSYLACAGLSHAQQHQACLQMARSWADQQQLDEAQDWLQRALALEPASMQAHWLQAQLAQQRGENQAALLALQRVLYLEPDFILGYFLQARLLSALGRARASDKALRVCRQLLEEQGDDAPLPHGDGMSCAQLLRVCEQLLEERNACPSP
jgi:chemotaxis protein methyltransferase CheR